jgi:hypothetical protein
MAIVTNTFEAVDLGVIEVVSTVTSVPGAVLLDTNGLAPALESW